MALYPCPECKREISTGAKACPHCGKDVRFAGTGARWRALPKFSKMLLIACVVVFAFGMWLDHLPKPVDGKTAQPLASSSVVPQTPATTPGRMAVQPGQWFGFRDRDLFDRASKIAAQGDKTAWAKVMSQAAASGDLVQLKPGEEVYLEDTAMMSGAVKVRRKGETSGWWTNYEAVK
jgi:hypothetical protein